MTDYHNVFDTKTYLELFYKTAKGNENIQGFLQFHMNAYHNFWSNFAQPGSLKTPKEIRYLEYGGGPVICSLISASPKVDRVVFAEYTEANRSSLTSWQAGRQDAHDWSPLIEYVVRDLKGDSTPQAVLNREVDIKRKIKSVVPCDATKTPIVDLESVDVGKPFDVVSTRLCLEACVTSEQQYKDAVAELCNMVKLDGNLCMYGMLEETFYNVGGTKFKVFHLTSAMVEEAMKKGGMEDIKIETFETSCTGDVSNACSLFSCFGRKCGGVVAE